jgi:hypothetical protein
MNIRNTVFVQCRGSRKKTDVISTIGFPTSMIKNYFIKVVLMISILQMYEILCYIGVFWTSRKRS